MKNTNLHSTSPRDLALLIALNETIANIANTETLFQTIYEKLKPVFHFEVAVIQLFSEDRQYLDFFLQGISIPEVLQNYPTKRRLRMSITEFPASIDLETEELQRFLVKDIPEDSKKDKELSRLFEEVLGIREHVICPLSYSGRVIGHLILATGRQGCIAEEDMPLLRQVCRVITTAVVNTVAYERLAEQEQRTEKVLHFTSTLLESQDIKGLRHILATGLRSLRPFHFLSLTGLPHLQGESGCIHFDGHLWRSSAEPAIPWIAPLQTPETEKRVHIHYYPPETLLTEFHAHPEALATFQHHGLSGGVSMSLNPSENITVTLFLGAGNEEIHSLLTEGIFEQAAPQLLLAIRALIHWERIQFLQNRLQLENRALYKEISSSAQDRQMLGEGPAFRQCLTRARQVAPVDTTVLILGETGTGKEMLAHYIHDLSSRHGKPMVRVNCASLPAPLIESELFGHEKGAFTGAVERRIGKFELAQDGTILLDEIGELPLESQAKLLRVLQEHELERVGGRGPIKINVRVLAATNRNLEEEVRAGLFRADLYFRLNVFPVQIPALRERREDIPMLADAFLRRFSRRQGRMLRPLTHEEGELLKSYDWPGNIRELEHMMERSAITSQGNQPNLREFRRAFLDDAPAGQQQQPLSPLDDLIRDHIVNALQRSGGRVSGPDGAAALLKINAKTLDSKIRKYGITRRIEIL